MNSETEFRECSTEGYPSVSISLPPQTEYIVILVFLMYKILAIFARNFVYPTSCSS